MDFDTTLDQAAQVAFRKLPAADQVAGIKGERVVRTLKVDRAAVDEEARTVNLAFASEQPYERWWGIEILDMGKTSMRLARLKDAGPLLVDHDPSDVVGVVESVALGADRIARAVVRFGRSARAEEIFRDVLDGIRTKVSVGYIIHDMKLERQEEGVNTYRVVDFEPLEVSLVSIPADATVGVGRSHQPEPERKPMTDNVTPVSPAAPDQVAAHRAAVEAATKREMERVSDLLKAGDVYKAHGGVELARELIGDPAATVDNFNRQILERMRASGSKPTATAEPGITSPYGSGARHMLRFGAKPKAFRAPILFSDGSKMEPLEAAYRSGQWLLATVAQNQKAARWCRDHGVDIEHRVMQTASSSLGGYLVPDEMEQSIIDLRESYGLARRLARRRVMGSDTKSIPKRTGGVTAYFIEEDNSGVTAADKSWGNVNLVAKTLAALTLISKNLEEDAVIDVVDDLAQEQAWAFAQKEDACWLNGDGTSTYGGMTGIITLMNATAYTSRFNAAANHDTYAEYDSSDLAGVMSGVADYAGVNPVWVCSKAFAEAVMNRIKAAAGGNTIATMQGRPTYNYLGYDVYTSELMHKDVTGDSSDTTIALFGDFGLSSAFGDRRGIMVEVLRERYAEKLQVGILAHERFSIVNHDLGSTTARGPVAALYGD